MSDRHLRSRLIRLAHDKPELRPHLLPLIKGAAEDDVKLEVTLEGSPELIQRMKLLLQAVQTLGSWGASRGVYIGIDGDGADRLKVHGLDKMDKSQGEKFEEAINSEVVGIGEKDYYGRKD